MTDWPEEYARLAATVTAGAPHARLLLAGFNTCVDHVHRLDADTLDALDDAAHADSDLCPLASEVMHRITSGGDGEVFVPQPELAPAVAGLFGEPVGRQLGGTGAQAAWAFAVLGAPSVLALADRSAAQLGVLYPTIGLAVPGGVRPVGSTPRVGRPTKPPHHILEYTAGTRWRGGVVPRSSRIIVRLAEDGIERDAAFAGLDPRPAGAGLVSGLNGIAEGDEASRRWLADLAGSWRAAGLPLLHLELAEYPFPELLADAARRYGGVAHSLGLSLAELATLHNVGDPVRAARDVAVRYGYQRVCVHADTWSIAVQLDGTDATAIRTGNLLAAARARRGAPTADLTPPPTASYTDDLPRAGPLGGGWWAVAAPTPYLVRPAATIGLGDTFVAGLLLAACLPTLTVSTPTEPATAESMATESTRTESSR